MPGVGSTRAGLFHWLLSPMLPMNRRRPPVFQLRYASHASLGLFPQAARAGSDDAGAPLLRVSPFATAADKKPDVRTAVSPVLTVSTGILFLPLALAG